MAAAKDLPTLKELRPIADTTDEISAAYLRLVAARENNQAEIERLEAARPSMITNATPAEIERSDEFVRKRRVFAEQLDVLEGELRRLFDATKLAEEDRAFDARRAELDAKVAVFNTAVLTEYPAACAAILALLDTERKLLSEFAELSLMAACGRKLQGLPLSVLTDAMVKGHVLEGVPPKSFGGEVSLPNINPGRRLWPRQRPRSA